LSPEESSSLGENAIRKRFRRGSILQIEGQPANFFAVLVRGSAKAVLFRPDGGEIILRFFAPGDFFGEANIIEGTTSPHSIIVIEDAELIFFEASLVADLMRSNGRFALDMYAHQGTLLHSVQKRLRDVLYERGDGRILRYFQEMASQIGVPFEGGILIDHLVSHQVIADTCGLARETVTRLLSQLEKRGRLQRAKEGWILSEPLTS
jgi:CRP/FNR family transcriptional regulator